MVNAISKAIIRSLNTEFGEEYQYGREEKPQEVPVPGFWVRCADHSCRLFLGNRYFRRNRFCIQYFPETKGQENEECCAAAERLFQCLEYLEVDGDLIRGRNMKYEITEGVLYFSVNYDLFLYRITEDVPVMEEVISETSVKG